MLDERIADRWMSIAASEEALLSRLVELLQADQRAVSQARADDLAENALRKETVLCETGLLEEARRALAESLPAPHASRPFADLPRSFPASRREQGLKAAARLHALRSAVEELNDLSRRIMVHGLYLVRSTMGILSGGGAVPGYGEDGGHRSSAPTGRIVRQNV